MGGEVPSLYDSLLVFSKQSPVFEFVVDSSCGYEQVNISPREEYGNGARSGVRGLSRDRAGDTEERSRVATVEGETPLDNTKIEGGASAAPGAGDLCLSMAIGISPAQLVAFAASFREVAPVARLVMFFEAPTSDRFNDIIDK